MHGREIPHLDGFDPREIGIDVGRSPRHAHNREYWEETQRYRELDRRPRRKIKRGWKSAKGKVE